MRRLPIALAAVLIAAPAAAQQASDRVTASPTLPQALSAESKAMPAAAASALSPGLPVLSADGQKVGKVFEVIRSPDGRANRVVIDADDGKQRAVPAANIRFEDGAARLTLNRAQLMALPPVQP